MIFVGGGNAQLGGALPGLVQSSPSVCNHFFHWISGLMMMVDHQDGIHK